jgi:hypothetical protein
MRERRLPQAILRAASVLAPAGERVAWLEEWHSELWYIPRHEAARFCCGAFRDALWLRRNSPRRAALESPVACLAFLAVLAAVSLWMAMRLPGPPGGLWPRHLRLRDLPAGCLGMLLLTCLMLPATRLAMAPPSAPHAPMAWPRALRNWTFLALKLALVQPVMLCGFIYLLLVGRWVPFVPQVGVFATWILTFRWILVDQRRRCPDCLRLLVSPVRFGTPSRTFLEWYGDESVCARGHGLLQVPEIAASFSGEQWLRI